MSSIAGETLQVYDVDTSEMSPTNEENKNSNIFFRIKQDGKVMTVKSFAENDEVLNQAFEDLKSPLPTNELLVYLTKNAADAFEDENFSTFFALYDRSKRRSREKINNAFTKDKNKRGGSASQATS